MPITFLDDPLIVVHIHPRCRRARVARGAGTWSSLDRGLSMAELIRRILREFMATHGGPAE